ncbi:MAG: hypothetical protein BGO90_02470 [Legionella sp. 40-6]|nr:MAG: hypothetical protein BGO90_02470 [Legionella sp. 40-6]
MSTRDEEKADADVEIYGPEENEAVSSYYRRDLAWRKNRRVINSLSAEQIKELEAFEEQGTKLAMPWLGMHHPDFIVSGDFEAYCSATGASTSSEAAIVSYAKRRYIEDALPGQDGIRVEEVEDMARDMGIPLEAIETILGLVRSSACEGDEQ